MGRHYVEQSKIDIENHKRVKEYEEKQLGGLREQLEKQREENLLLRGIQESLKADQAKFKSDALTLEKELKAFRKLTEEYRTLQDKNRIHAS